ncbi:MAG: NAD(P)-dependent oxidoreductase [Bacteroidia bacterium]
MECLDKQILICDDSPAFFIESLETKGFVVDYQPLISNAQLIEQPNKYSSILIKSALILDRAFFEHFSNINLVLRPGSGLDNVDKAYCKANGITIINSPNGNSNAVGEHAMGLLLNLTNNLNKAITEVKQLKWVREPNRGIELENRNVAVIGVGNAGTAFCKKLTGFGVKLLPHDKYKPFLDSINQNSVSISKVFEKADVVSLHLPLNSETHYYANDEFFNSFRKPIYFLNTSRGKVLNTRSLLNAINKGIVIKAAIDVIETEPIHKSSNREIETLQALINTGKVLITPHIAGWTHEAKQKMFSILLDKYAQL